MHIQHHRLRDWENRALILLKFRNGEADSLEGLWKAMKTDHFLGMHMLRFVRELVEAGLLQADDASDLSHTKIRVSEQLSRIQTALGLSLTFLANFDRTQSIVAEPMFGLPKELEKLDVFVLMPFKEELSPVYEDHIKPTCTKLGLTVRRGDDFFTAEAVVKDIWAAIWSARLVIADCTGRNPNVFYEIGVSHTIGQPTILLTQRPKDVPFDLRHLRYIQYELTPRGMKEFEETLDLTIRNSIDVPVAVPSKYR